MLHYNYICQII